MKLGFVGKNLGKNLVVALSLLAAGFFAAWLRYQPHLGRTGEFTDGIHSYNSSSAEPIRYAVWEEAQRLAGEVQTNEGEHRPAISPDGRWLVFVSGERGTNSELYLAELQGTEGLDPRPLYELNSTFDELAPAFGEDGLYFASNRPGVGGFDLWRADFDAAGQFDAPVLLDESINTTRDELDPAPLPEGNGLAFASNEKVPGRVGHDFYTALPRVSGGYEVQALDELNSWQDDRELAFSHDGRLAFFASDRNGLRGAFDLYSSLFERGEWLKPLGMKGLNTSANERGPVPGRSGFELYFERSEPATTGDNLLGANLYHARSLEIFQRPGPRVGWLDVLILIALLVLALLAWLAKSWDAIEVLYKCFLVSLLVHGAMLWWFRDIHPESEPALLNEMSPTYSVHLAMSSKAKAQLEERSGALQVSPSPAQDANQEPSRQSSTPEASDSAAEPQAAQLARATAPTGSAAAEEREWSPEEQLQAQAEGLADAPEIERRNLGDQATPALEKPTAVATSNREAEGASEPTQRERQATQADAAQPTERSLAKAQPTDPNQLPESSSPGAADAAPSEATVAATDLRRAAEPADQERTQLGPVPRASSESLPEAQSIADAGPRAEASAAVSPGRRPSGPASAQDHVEPGAMALELHRDQGAQPGDGLRPAERSTDDLTPRRSEGALASATDLRRASDPAGPRRAEMGPTDELSAASLPSPVNTGAQASRVPGATANSPERHAAQSATTDSTLAPGSRNMDLDRAQRTGSDTLPASTPRPEADMAPSQSGLASAELRQAPDPAHSSRVELGSSDALEQESLPLPSSTGALASRSRLGQDDALVRRSSTQAPTTELDEPGVRALRAQASPGILNELPGQADFDPGPERGAVGDLLATNLPGRALVEPATESSRVDLATEEFGGLAPMGISPASRRKTAAGDSAPTRRLAAHAKAASAVQPKAAAVEADARIQAAPPVLAQVERLDHTPYRSRFGPAKARALEEHGGTLETEAAVASGLAYLARVQDGAGFWGDKRFMHDKYGEVRVGKTGLALLAFLGAGHTPDSNTQYSDVTERAIEYLLSVQRGESGHFGRTASYSHGIATYAVAETFALTGMTRLKRPLERAVAEILRNQHGKRADQRRFGGWGYYDHRGRAFDSWPRASITAWQVMALESARLGGIEVPDQAFADARTFLVGCLDPRRGIFRYSHDPDRLRGAYSILPGSTPASLFALSLLEVDMEHEEFTRAWRFMSERAPTEYRYRGDDAFVHRAQGNLYFWYYGSLASMRRGGSTWKRWNVNLQEALLGSQRSDGSWKPISVYALKHANDDSSDATYSTAMNVLSLEVYYRYFTPLLKVSTGSGR